MTRLPLALVDVIDPVRCPLLPMIPSWPLSVAELVPVVVPLIFPPLSIVPITVESTPVFVLCPVPLKVPSEAIVIMPVPLWFTLGVTKVPTHRPVKGETTAFELAPLPPHPTIVAKAIAPRKMRKFLDEGVSRVFIVDSTDPGGQSLGFDSNALFRQLYRTRIPLLQSSPGVDSQFNRVAKGLNAKLARVPGRV